MLLFFSDDIFIGHPLYPSSLSSNRWQFVGDAIATSAVSIQLIVSTSFDCIL